MRKATIYIYCFKQHNGTFAFPMSLFESLSVGTPFIGPNLSGVREFFSNEFLCDGKNIYSASDLAINILNNKNIYHEVAKEYQSVLRKVKKL